MITRSPFGAISYNTDDFLRNKLKLLVEDGTLQFWYIIHHMPEEDEQKPHYHVYFVPCKQVDTFVLQNCFDEFDPKCPEIPLKTKIGGHSKFVDKYLYDKHDPDYLAAKGLVRKYHYNDSDFITSDDDYFWELIHMSDMTMYKKEADFKRACKKGTSFVNLLDNGFVPIQQIYQYKLAYNMLSPYIVDSGTGELISKLTGKPISFEDPTDDEGV